MTHGIFAGTGGGMGSRLLSRVAEEYPEIPQLTASVLPTYSVDDGCVIRPYNVVLSLQYLAEHADLTWLFSHWVGIVLIKHPFLPYESGVILR
jgi:hypothetical protein